MSFPLTDRGGHGGCTSPLPSSCPSPLPQLCRIHTNCSTVGKSHEAAVEEEYDRLRDLARAEGGKRAKCFERSKAAYNSGDKAEAKRLSDEGKAHGREMEKWNKAASDYIFREENSDQPADTIDLHGQFAEEAEDIVEEAIKMRKQNGETHLRVIVGKGNHSVGGVMKIRPRVEKVCGELGLNWRQERNAGILYIDLTGGEANPDQNARPQQHRPQQSHGDAQPGYPGAQQQHRPQQHGGQQQHQQQDNAGGELVGLLLKKLEKACCIMM